MCAEHGVPDVVVNNAGIGQAGRFLDTPADEWDRVLDINLGGVVNGCRAFARRLVERGSGGHIVNVASAAAFAPLQSLNAYCTSKAAVYMFSDCLRAELDAAGIGLTTVCPGPVHTNIVSTARFDAPPGKVPQVSGRRRQWEKPSPHGVTVPRRRRRPSCRRCRRTSHPPGHAGGLPAVRHVAPGAAGVAQHRARPGDVTLQICPLTRKRPQLQLAEVGLKTTFIR